MELPEQGPRIPLAKRHRRRWLIVAVVLALVSAVSWWYWPRGDARFVGKWRLQVAGGPNVIWTFDRN
jgi:hypothetical protein